jgi:hypothetical protein
MIVLEATAVHESGRLTAHTLAGYQPEIVAGYRRVVEAVRPHGTRLFVQLFHGGRELIAALPGRPRSRRRRSRASASTSSLGAHRCRDRRDRRGIRPLGRAGCRGRARRDRALGRARLPLRAVLHAGPQPPRGRVGGGAAAPRRRRRRPCGTQHRPRARRPALGRLRGRVDVARRSAASWTTCPSPSATRPPIAAHGNRPRRRRSREAPSQGSRRRSASGRL